MFNKRRASDKHPDQCPMTQAQFEQLMSDMSDIKKYLFAGRVVIGTLVFIGLTLDWTRDHMSIIKTWINK